MACETSTRCSISSRTSARFQLLLLLVLLVDRSCDTVEAVDQHALRISEFVDGTDGWRVLPALPRSTAFDSAGAILDVDSPSTPIFFILPDDITAEVISAVTADSTQLVLQAQVGFPDACLDDRLECIASVVVLGNRCAVQKPIQSLAIDLLWHLHPGQSRGDTWEFCSQLIQQPGTCTESSTAAAMANALADLQFIVFGVEAKFVGGTSQDPLPQGPYNFRVSALSLQRSSSPPTVSFNPAPWLRIPTPALPPPCRATRNPSCEWDACDDSAHSLLMASCQGPYGTAQPHCWSQPFPVRYGMQIFSFKLLNDCYTHFECVGAMPVALNATREVLQAQVGGAGVWYWVAPTEWFAAAPGSESGTDILGMMVQVEIGVARGAVTEGAHIHAVVGPDVVVLGREGGSVGCDFPRPITQQSAVITVHLSEQAGCRLLEEGDASGLTHTVESVLTMAAGLLVRGVHVSVDGVGPVGSELGAVAVLDPPFTVSGSGPTSGPMSGGTRVQVVGSEFADVVGRQQVCVWRCSSDIEEVFLSNLAVLNSTLVSCIAPWVGEARLCKMALANLIAGKPYVTAILPDFQYYAPPFISHLSTYTVPAAGGIMLSLHGSGFSALSNGRCLFVFLCHLGGAGGGQRIVTSAARIPRGSVAAPGAEATEVQCLVPEAPCVGPAVVSLSLNGLDFTHDPNQCPDAGPMGCRVEVAAADPDGNDEDADEDENQDGNEGGGSDVVVPPGDDDVKEPSEEGRQAQDVCCTMDSEKDCLRCCSALKLSLVDAAACLDCCPLIVRKHNLEHTFATLFAILVPYALFAYPATRVAVKRLHVREDNGAAEPYDMKEAYLLWLLFGPLGAHRYYLGERGNFLVAYAASLGLFGLLWLADGWWTRQMVAEKNKSNKNTMSTLGAADAVTNLLVEGDDRYVDLDSPDHRDRDREHGASERGRSGGLGLMQHAGSMAASTASGFQQGLQRSFKGKGARGNNDEMEMTSLARPESDSRDAQQ